MEYKTFIRNGRITKDITNLKFGKLTAICIDEETSNEKGRVYWRCKCECGNVISICGSSLRTGNSKSCGCIQKEKVGNLNKKYNTYDLESKEYGIGYTEEGEEFWFDKEDYDKIKNLYWTIDDSGRVVHKDYKTNQPIYIHRLIMNIDKHDIQVDHIKHNRFDNRKSQLRLVNNQQNNRNKGLSKANTSGVTGVYYNKQTDSWYSQIKVDYKIIHLGTFSTKEEAIKVRKAAEEKYFGEYSYDNSIK